MRLYKLSHFTNYSGDERQTFNSVQSHYSRTKIARAVASTARTDGAIPEHSGNQRPCRCSSEAGRRDRSIVDRRNASSGKHDHGKLGQQSRKNFGRTIKAEGFDGCRTQKKTLMWWCVFGKVSVSERVWRTEQKEYLRLLPEAIGVSARGRSKRLERVLTDFGCEHSFKHAAARVLEHYGFEINASAVRDATLQNAGRAEQMLQKEYEESFRVLPAVGAQHVVAEADGSMVCTVA